MSDAEHEFALRLDARVDELGERLAMIEGGINQKPALSLRQKASMVLGALAFGMSLFLSGYTVYDKLFTEPREEREEQETDLRDDLNTLADLAGRIAELDSANDPEAARVQADLLAPQRTALHTSILKADAELRGFLVFADYLLLARDLEAAGSYSQALAPISNARRLATTSTESANVYWSQARIEGGLKQLDAMRSTFASAISEFKVLDTGSASLVLQVYRDWVTLELIHGDCSTAASVHSLMLVDFNAPGVRVGTRVNFVPRYNQMLANAERQCPLFLDLPSIFPQ